RIQLVNGNATFFGCELDIHQNYVDTAAIKAGVSRTELLKKNISSIRDTFASYDIGFDLFNTSRSQNTTKFIIDFVAPLFQSQYVKKKDVEFYFDENSGKFLVEGFISGSCSKCAAPVKGGICEICGYYNFSIDIINPFSTINPDAIIIKKKCKIHVLDTLFFREKLLQKFGTIGISDDIRKFISDILATLGNYFPVTLPLDYGLAFGEHGMRLNPWVELLGITYYLKDSARKALDCKTWSELSHVCFIGIDNTFYYIIIHGLLRFTLGFDDFPQNYVVNKFYTFNQAKFSTSKNHGIWADEAVLQFDASLLRVFLALTHPDKEAYDFSLDQLIAFKTQLEANDWIKKLYNALESNLENTQKLDRLDAKSNARLLFDIINNTDNISNVRYLVQVICPSLFKKAIRQIGKVPHIVKETSNSFKREFGVELNRLIALDEYKFGSSVVIVEPGEQTTPHAHDTLDELFYIIHGQGLLTLGEKDSVVNKGDYIYIPAGMAHTLRSLNEKEVKFITIAWYI
ncbi:MAG: hypothetical protein RL017_383, partial [Pseudomonadota bacterium]